MADTALDIVTNALLDLGVLADEETPTASQAAGGLRKLNNMIEAWGIEKLMVYGALQTVYSLNAGQGSYTIGPGGIFPTARPTDILTANLRVTATNYDRPLAILNQAEYAALPLKQLTGMPNAVYFNETFPLMEFYVTPIPDTSGYGLVVWSGVTIANLALTDVIQLAPGYKRALESNLVIELSGSYERQVPESVALIAQTSKADLKTQNFQLNELKLDPRLTGPGYFNYYTG